MSSKMTLLLKNECVETYLIVPVHNLAAVLRVLDCYLYKFDSQPFLTEDEELKRNGLREAKQSGTEYVSLFISFLNLSSATACIPVLLAMGCVDAQGQGWSNAGQVYIVSADNAALPPVLCETEQHYKVAKVTIK